MKAIVDSDGYVIGVGCDRNSAVDNAVNHMMNDPRDYLAELAWDMSCVKVTDELAEYIRKNGTNDCYITLADGTLDAPEV